MPSPLCEIRDGAGAYTPQANGKDVTPGNAVVIRLVSQADVENWFIQCVSTDETSDKNTINAGLVIDPLAKTATFTAPSSGRALRFQSVVNQGRGPDGVVVPSYSTTLIVHTLTGGGHRVIASDETLEADLIFGYTAKLNPFIRNPSPGSGEANTVTNVGTGGAANIAEAKSGVDIPVRGIQGIGSTTAVVNGHNVDVDADGVATIVTSATGDIDDQATLSSGRNATKIIFTGAAPVLRSLLDLADKRRPVTLVANGGPLVITHEYASATASKRITTATGADVTIPQGSHTTVAPDATGSRWRLAHASGSGGGGGATPGAPEGSIQLAGPSNTFVGLMGTDDRDIPVFDGTEFVIEPGLEFPAGDPRDVIVQGATANAPESKKPYAIGYQASFTFASDANETLDATKSQATILIVANGTITAPRTITVNRGPSGATVGDKLLVVNNQATHAVTVKWATGTGISIPAGKSLIVGSDGTNAIDLMQEASGGGVSVPTGTGFWRNSSSGVLDAAASAVNLAGGSTHVTGILPLANVGAPTGTGYAKVASSVWAGSAQAVPIPIADGGTNRTTVPGSADEVIVNDSTTGYKAASNVKALSSAIRIGSTPTNTDGIGLANNTGVYFRNPGNSLMVLALQLDSSGVIRIGDANSQNVVISYEATTGIYNQDSAVYDVLVNEDADVTFRLPRHGMSTPFANEGTGTVALGSFSEPGNTNVGASEYSRKRINITGSGGGSGGPYTITFPTPASADAEYGKPVKNSTNLALRIKLAAGTTYDLAAGAQAYLWFATGGVELAAS